MPNEKQKAAGSLEVAVYSGRGFSEEKSKGKPMYCKIKLGRELYGTDLSTTLQCVNPKWDTKALFRNVQLPCKHSLAITCLTKGNKFVGRVTVPLGLDMLEKPERNEWYPLLDKKDKKTGNITGSLHLALKFQCRDCDSGEQVKETSTKEKKKPVENAREKLFEGVQPTAPEKLLGGVVSYDPTKDKSNVNLQMPSLSPESDLNSIECIEREMAQVTAQSKQSTKKSLKILEKTTEVGANTMAKLEMQGEQLKHLSHDMDIVDSNVEQGAKEIKSIKSFWGRFARNKSKKSLLESQYKMQRAPGNPQERRDQSLALPGMKEVKERNNLGRYSRPAEGSTTSTSQQPHDEVDDDLDRMGVLTSRLKEMALDFSGEISEQDKTIEKLHNQTESSYFKIRKQQQEIQKRL